MPEVGRNPKSHRHSKAQTGKFRRAMACKVQRDVMLRQTRACYSASLRKASVPPPSAHGAAGPCTGSGGRTSTGLSAADTTLTKSSAKTLNRKTMYHGHPCTADESRRQTLSQCHSEFLLHSPSNLRTHIFPQNMSRGAREQVAPDNLVIHPT